MFIREIKIPVTRIKGAGPKTAELLKNRGIHTVGDLLLTYPRGWEDRQKRQPLKEALPEGTVNTVAEVTAHDWIGRPPRQTLKVLIHDGTASGALLCFGRNFLQSKLPIGQRIRLFGRFQYKYQEFQASSFEFEPLTEDSYEGSAESLFGRILPLYSLTEGISQSKMRHLMAAALDEYGRGLSEELPKDIQESKGLLPLEEALAFLHFPPDQEALEAARRRLIYQELFHLELTIARQKPPLGSKGSPRRQLPRGLQEKLKAALPFSLTADQAAAVEEITADMEGPRPMHRLLQGDVGCGKTLAAFLAALPVIEAGEQAALMAPTELLARQHADKAAQLLDPLGVRVAFVSGQLTGEARTLLTEKIHRGEVDLAVGTHALFSEDLSFRNLSLVIVDEQHRFGVAQRQSLSAKGREPHLLMMSATPIPRSLALTAYGNLDVSVIRTMPAGRQPIKTRLVHPRDTERMYRYLAEEAEGGRQSYIVYPLIEDSEKALAPSGEPLRNAQRMFQELKESAFRDIPCALIHSRLPAEEKETAMAAFSRGEIKILVATSVVEVGVDVAAATIMVVEHADRFGLSALHQLRGRVGRGTLPSWCFLVYTPGLSEEGKQRLTVMRDHLDGFRIAEEDLKIRGPGELAGIRQSGYLQLRIADITRDLETLKEARRDAFARVKGDPGFLNPENEPLRFLFAQAPPFTDTLIASG